MCLTVCAGAEVKTVSTPPFAESVTEGDIKWNKGVTLANDHCLASCCVVFTVWLS